MEAQESISDLGEVLVSLLYNENLHRLSVTVIEARRLKFREERRDSYVRVTLNQHYRTVKVKRTATVKGTDSPNFSECFNFRVPAAQIDVTSVSFQVLQAVSGYGRELWKITNQKEITIEIKRRKWNWIGHTIRKEDGAVERMGSRTRGRPKNKWKRIVLEEIAREGKTWSEVKKLATNRVRWRHFVNALCSS
ncbi:hypothetical protein ANN_14347 [Periplaneta americana]|uniref:C2 domain-containing protein n=1 Tax=Periplaneta americana TaxID=6978 RepID=A0ABQ8SW23_PERAM|nr:hypothetical protein ANN_14347 [Periplaneta americana]